MELTLGTWDHDRVMALHDGRIEIPNVTLKSEIHPTSKNETTILEELTSAEGNPADLGGYYLTDQQKTEGVMRASPTLLRILSEL
jgi:monomeric isocitrate dehydrogenase